MRRISRDWDKLATQLESAGRGISGEPAWPGSAPTQAEVEAAADAIRDFRTQIIAAENLMQGLRSEFAKAMENGGRIMRLVDYVTSGLYGETGAGKIVFGVRPIDRTRNSPGPTPKVTKVVLSDGPGSGSIALRWKPIPRATYEVQWFGEETLESLMGAMVSTKSRAPIPALRPGLQIWVRVRALRGGKLGAWSDPATRVAPV